MRTLNVETVIGGPVALECDFVSSNPPPEVVWCDDKGSVVAEVPLNNEIRYLEGGRYLLLRRLTSAQRVRRYHCKVTNFVDVNGVHVRAPTTYSLARDPAINKFTEYLSLGMQVGRVGEVLTFSYVATRRNSDGHFIHYAINCSNNSLLTVTIQNTIILHVTLLEAARTASEAEFNCSLVGLGANTNIISGSVRVSSKNTFM